MFARHDIQLSQNIGFIKIGFEDIHEWNERTQQGTDYLSNASYRFYDWKTSISTSDSIKNKFGIYYRERYDWFSDSTYLKQSTRAQNVGLDADLGRNPASNLRLNLNYRFLDVLDTTLFNGKPENTLLGRLEHTARLWKGAILATTFYEVGSGLELKREFIYLEVNPGQGTYTWIDYNNDGIKDLGDKINFGFLAQDLLDTFGTDYNFVTKNENDDFYKVNYYQLISPIISVIQEQQKEIAFLKEELLKLKKDVPYDDL